MDIFPDTYPIEYIHGKVHFFGRDFIVTPDVLIPRLETECLIKRARDILHKSAHPITVIDIGCGSGIIGTSIADLADEIIFLDISTKALEIAKENFHTHFGNKKSQFIVSDLLDGFISPHFMGSQKGYPTQPPLQGEEPASSHILLLTNLPYIKQDDWINMSADTVHEPRLALFGGDITGFEMYERLFSQISDFVKLGKSESIQVLFEFGFDQRQIAEIILKGYSWQYEFFSDYAGIERFGEIIIS